MTDYRVLPTNRLTCRLSGSDIYHCQLLLWSHADRAFETYSVDVYQNRVFRMTTKNFRRGWSFYRITVTAEQERAAHNFLHAQLNKPFNRIGMHLIFIWPYSGNGESWFCSELTAAALQAMGYLKNERPAALYPSYVRDRVLEAGDITVVQVNHPIERTRRQLAIRAELAAPPDVQVYGSDTILRFSRNATVRK